MNSKRIRRAPRAEGGSGGTRTRRARRRTAIALRESEGRYRSLFENMAEGVAYCRMVYVDGRPTDFVYLAVNEAFEKSTGLRNVVGKRVSEVIHGIRESDPEIIESYGRVARTGNPERFERFVKALGLYLSISVYSPKRGYFVAIFTTVSTRTQAELESKLFRALIERTGDAIHVVDPKTARFLDVNESACKSLGYAREELLDMGVMDVTVGIDLEQFYANYELMKRTGSTTVENIHKRKDGATFPTEVSLSPVTLDREYLVAIVRGK